MSDLLAQKCIPCEGGTLPMSEQEIQIYMPHVEGWKVKEAKELSREFKFADFAEAMAFTNKIAEIAEKEGHHPDLLVSWGKVGVSLTTHAVGGLSVNDFILAAKIDALTQK